MKRFLIIPMALSLILFSCKQKDQNEDVDSTITEDMEAMKDPFFKLSLAQWSLNEPMRNGELSPMLFAKKASEMGFAGIEYVSQLYTPELENMEMGELLDSLKAESDRHSLRNVLIMVDNEGDLASAKANERDAAVEKHKKWVDAAAFLGCHSIRVNLFGAEDLEDWKKASVDGLSKLSDYAATKNINVLVENHGGYSSNAEALVDVIKTVGKDNCGTLPDFGNFCLKREGGARWEAACVEEYDIYKGIEEMMPFAKAVSAKSYNFNDAGQETKLDYGRILKIVKDAGYDSYIGVEYEGNLDDPEEGIRLTKELLLSEAAKLN